MKKMYLLLICCYLATLPACNLFNKDNDDDDNSLIDFELYTNPTDGAIFKVTLEDGAQVTYFGEKDDEGLPINIQSASFMYPGEAVPYVLVLDELQLPEKILAPNNTVYNFAWTGETKIRLTAITGDGKAQVSIPIDLDTLGSKYIRVATNQVPNIRKGQNTSMRLIPLQDTQHKGSLETNSLMTVNVTSCGRPLENAVVRVNTEPQLGVPNMVANNAGAGNYTANIPHDPDRLANIDQECQKLIDHINMVCSTVGNSKMSELENNPAKKQLLCGAIHTAMLFMDITDEDRKKISDVCPKVVTLAAGLCEVVRTQKDLLNSCKLGKAIGTIPMSTPYKFTLSISAPGLETVYTDPTLFDPEIADTWDMEVGGNMFIENLHTEPADPGPEQGYTAYATIVCIPEGGIPVTISVVGSDGYTSSHSDYIYDNYTISLVVPGGAESVRDVITVEAEDLSASMSIVF